MNSKININKVYSIIASAILCLMFIVLILLAKNTALTIDEGPHILAGYTYWQFGDYRANPEHPPLFKDLAGLPVYLSKPNWPKDNLLFNDSKTNPYVSQSLDSREFLFNSGNDADKLIFLARIPMILITILLGFVIFWWTRKNWGNNPALLALSLYAFNPNFLAHGCLVTNDILSALACLMLVITWIDFIKNKAKKTFAFFVLALALCLLTKFSLGTALISILFFCFVYSGLTNKKGDLKEYLLPAIGGMILSFGIIYLVYAWNLRNQPIDNLIANAKFLEGINLSSLYSIPGLAPIVHWFFGLFIALSRSANGSVVSFLGNIGNSWWYYFPVLWFAKNPIMLNVMAILGLASVKNNYKKANELEKHPELIMMIVFIIFYWVVLINSSLNIGVRHLFPVTIFMFILIAICFCDVLDNFKTKLNKKYILIACVIFYAIPAIISYPNYLPYYNFLAGGTDNGYKIASDSNYDWGQDINKLQKYVNVNKIQNLKIDYFGIADPNYYLKNSWQPLDPTKGKQTGWLAVSITSYQKGVGLPIDLEERYKQVFIFNYYDWLKDYQPVDRVGKSIFIYHIQN